MIYRSLTILGIIFLNFNQLLAQNGPPGPGPGQGQAPITESIALLIGGGILLGSKFFSKKKK